MSDVLTVIFFAICLAIGLELAFEALCLVIRLKQWLVPHPSGRDLAGASRAGVDGSAVEMTSPRHGPKP
jgi:hypothetical protein